MLSDVEMWREFGKGIVIWPFKPNNNIEKKINGEYRSNIDGASIYVTASEVGWHFAKTGKTDAGKRLLLENGENGKELIIPANEWVILSTEETIYLSDRFSGTCLTKVKVAINGLVQTEAPLKPGSSSRLLIKMCNHTNEDIHIKVGAQIAVVTFYKPRIKPSIKKDKEADKWKFMRNEGYDLTSIDDDAPARYSYLCKYSIEEARVKMKADIKEHRKNIKKNKTAYGYRYTGRSEPLKLFLLILLAVAVLVGVSSGFWFLLSLPFTSILALVLIMALSIALFIMSFLPPFSEHASWMRYGGTAIFVGIIMAVVTLMISGNNTVPINTGDLP